MSCAIKGATTAGVAQAFAGGAADSRVHYRFVVTALLALGRHPAAPCRRPLHPLGIGK